MSTIATPMPGSAPHLADKEVTPEQLLRMPHGSTLELVDGKLVEKNVSIDSSRIAARIITLFGLYEQGRGNIAIFGPDQGYQCFGDQQTIRKPDVSLISNDRLAKLPDQTAGYSPIAPDLAVEVMSKNDTDREMARKVGEYQDANFPLIWVVYPASRWLVAHPLGHHPILLTADDDVPAPPFMPDFAAKVGDFFAGVPTD